MDPGTLERTRNVNEGREVTISTATPSNAIELIAASTSASAGSQPPAWRVERWLLKRLLIALGNVPLTVQLWDGTEVAAVDGSRNARMIVRDRPTLWKLILDPTFQFGEGYATGRIDVDGSLDELLRAVNTRCTGGRAGIVPGWVHRPRRNTLSGSQKNIHHHYDIGNDFYELWLDEQLAYTCAYFSRPSQSLEEAQVAKMDHVCRKLWLRKGETVVEAGCGWGALALHMARQYGVTVEAYNISSEQIAYARQRANDENLADRVKFIQDDWRNIKGRYDAFVSVGMLEHVGLANYGRLGDVIARSLHKGGRGLIHTIGQNYPRPFDRWTQQRIFPGAYPPTLAQMMNIFEKKGFSVLDVENLRLHYAETLRHWWERYERSADVVAKMFDERFLRMWRLYLAASMVAFQVGNLQLFQVVFAPGRSNGVPRTREYQYADVDLMFAEGSDSPLPGEGPWNTATS
ncbi:MAG: cyclopropane-fatty-acyl-phospholipid synthase family protein [Planctomycetaceae bacterium]